MKFPTFVPVVWNFLNRAAVVSVLALLPCAAIAQISGNDLFLSPSAVPQSTGYITDILSVPGSLSFSASDGGGTSLLGLHILPLLSSNPGTAGGEYTAASLAAINVSNYSAYYAFQPNVDYFATTITNNSSTVTFGQRGSYFVGLDVVKNGSVSTTLINVRVADNFLAGPDGPNPAGPERRLAGPTSDLTIVADEAGDDALADAATVSGGTKAKDLAAVKQAIIDYYNSHGKKKFTLCLIGHGRPGSIRFGTERINSDPGGTMTPAAFQAMIDPYVSGIEFYSCSTAADQKGQEFLKAFASSIGSASGFNEPITITSTYFDISATGRRLTVVPEPSALALFVGLGITGGGFLARRRARKAA